MRGPLLIALSLLAQFLYAGWRERRREAWRRDAREFWKEGGR